MNRHYHNFCPNARGRQKYLLLVGVKAVFVLEIFLKCCKICLLKTIKIKK